MRESLSSSSGQMSGQFVNPKYICIGFDSVSKMFDPNNARGGKEAVGCSTRRVVRSFD